MTPRIACLHTAESNVAAFSEALARTAPGAAELAHVVRADLLAQAEAGSGLSPALADRTLSALEALRARADAVLLTCSTLGPVVERVPPGEVPVLRTDAALARDAVAAGGAVVVLCAVETTLAPTRALFTHAARDTGARVEVRLVAGAWALFKDGDLAGYAALVAQAADAVAPDARVALAQASMAGAAALARRPLLTSPMAGLEAALAAAAQSSR